MFDKYPLDYIGKNMEMKQISDTTLKITISMDDLEERGMELKDFLVPQEKTEEFFYAVMDELDLPETFKNSGMLSFRVTPRKDRLDVFVTKTEIGQELNLEDLGHLEELSHMSPEEFFKTLEKTMRDKGNVEALDHLAAVEGAENAEQDTADLEVEEELPDYIHYVLHFKTLKDVKRFVDTVDYEVEASELYKAKDGYHMTVLVNLENKPSYYAGLMLSRMVEHAKISSKTRAYLQEHGVQLLMYDALSDLRAIR